MPRLHRQNIPLHSVGVSAELAASPLDSETLAVSAWRSTPGAFLMLQQRQSVPRLVERRETSLLDSQLILLDDPAWERRLKAMPAGASLVQSGPPPTDEQFGALFAAGRVRPVSLFIQQSDSYARWTLRERLASGGARVVDAEAATDNTVRRVNAAAGFPRAAIEVCRGAGVAFDAIRICIPDTPDRGLLGELHEHAAMLGVPLHSTENLIGGMSSPAMVVVAQLASCDLAPDSVKLIAQSSAGELGAQLEKHLFDLTRDLATRTNDDDRKHALIDIGSKLHARFPDRELYPGVTDRLLVEARRTARSGTSLKDWLAPLMEPSFRERDIGCANGVRVSRISDAGSHAVALTVIADSLAAERPEQSKVAFAVTDQLVRVSG